MLTQFMDEKFRYVSRPTTLLLKHKPSFYVLLISSATIFVESDILLIMHFYCHPFQN